MSSAANSELRALASRLLGHANRGTHRVEFLRDALQTLLDVSGCDRVELYLNESERAYCCQLERGQRGAFRLARCVLGNELVDDGEFLAYPYSYPEPQTLRSSTWTGPTDYGSRWRDTLASEPGGGSRTVIPLRVGLERLGWVELFSVEKGAFGAESLERYEALSETLALALAYQRARWATSERVKELTCLYAIAQVVEQQELSIDQIMQSIAELLPPGWQYPEICSARILLHGRAFVAAGYQEAVSRQRADILVDGRAQGTVEVVYTEAMPELDEGPFLKEERSLINEVARQIALLVKRRQAEEEKSRLQEQLRHADRLVTIGQLAAGVAHELNEPLGAILGFGQLARKCARLPAQAGADIDKIIKAALHAREIVRKLMLFGRQTPPRKTPVLLNQVVEDSLALVRQRCDNDGIGLICELEPDLPAITADSGQLRQVIVNLVVNAIQAMPGGGNITISTRADRDWVYLIVVDTGHGMAESVLRQIFVPFFTTKEVGQGTGLGLSVVHGIVASHGGTITVQSQPDCGARFEVRLPRSSQGETPAGGELQ